MAGAVRGAKMRMSLTNRKDGAAPAGVKRVCIVGLPNSGKSQLYNGITGTYALVSNYPQTTVEVSSHRARVEGEAWEVTDTPGLHGLYIQSEEEQVVRRLLYVDPPDALVQCVDAHRLRESLLLTADLVGLGIPLVVVLTAVGERARRGVRIDAAALSRLLGLPVIPSPAPGQGVAECTRVLLGALPPPRPVDFGPDLEQAIARLSTLLPDSLPHHRASSLLLLENDPTFPAAAFGEGARQGTSADTARPGGDGASGTMEGMTEAVERIRAGLAGQAPLLVSRRKNQWVDAIAARVTDSVPPSSTRPRPSETFARLCRHPLYGLPILAFFLCLIYVMVVYVAGALSLFLTTALTDPVIAAVDHLLPDGLWKSLLTGQYGLLTLGLFNSLTTVLPILTVFFLVFGILEDIGYLPNLAILTRRVLAKIGITGNAVIPLVLGFGCKTMATMTARTLPSRKERLIVIALVAFAIPCSAQMGLSIAILGGHGVRYFIAAFGFLALAEVIAGLLLNRFIPDDGSGQFIQELPPIRLPRLSAVAQKTGYRLLWFLREAIPIFIAAALVMFAIDATGLLGLLKRALAPLITGWLGLPLDMVDALLLTLARSEAAAGYVLQMSRAGTLNGMQSVLAVILLTTFAQCFANIAAMFKEVGVRAAAVIMAAVYVTSIVYTGAVHALLALIARWGGT
jgi:ferrous iron transport protein B